MGDIYQVIVERDNLAPYYWSKLKTAIPKKNNYHLLHTNLDEFLAEYVLLKCYDLVNFSIV